MSDDLIPSGSGNGKSEGRAPRARVPANESREDKFVRLAEQRMPNVQKHMRLVCNLADYPHTDEQRSEILASCARSWPKSRLRSRRPIAATSSSSRGEQRHGEGEHDDHHR
jgi:hypothetical protein